MASDISRYVVYREFPAMYTPWWWSTEFISVLLGYWVIMDLLEKVLTPYVGTRKFARAAGLSVLVAVVSITIFEWIAEKHSSLALTTVEVERNLRSAEAILICVLLLIVAFYGISIGKNLKGILLGYGLYVALDVIVHASMSFTGYSLQSLFSLIRNYSYLLALLVWTFTLWSYYPVSSPEGLVHPEADYQSLATGTREKLGTLGSYFGRPGRP
ncbi:MAG TPA: hypothetical protein VJR23_09485 [Candidatus Acidoferrales bacterium]|nr:hypothetical protein [Candidatus Acidoferrales bacterium]